jgi:hypothetical protein
MELLRPKKVKFYQGNMIKTLAQMYKSVYEAFQLVKKGLWVIRYNQSAEPSLDTGNLSIWRDTDDGKVYLVYNDPDTGQVTVELT